MANRFHILVVDDEPVQREMIGGFLKKQGFEVVAADSAESALELFRQDAFDLVLTDQKMARMSGLELLRAVHAINPETPVILITAFGTIEAAVAALKQGAIDYLTKPLNLDELLHRIRQVSDRYRIINENRELREALLERHRIEGIIGASGPMLEVLSMVRRVASSEATVLIRGESGTGKELIARSIHTNSLRSSETFQAVNCAAINENLLESELFGHEKGSFTGAVADKKGLFEIAHNGTLFLDEIGELDISLQAKILRALQEKQIRRVGGIKDIDVDVRVVSATNRDLLHMVEEKRFREDLYYRLNVLSIELPALRERRTDIPVLIDYFVKKHTRNTNRKISINADARRLLEDYAYPGNVRQLESALERAILLCENDVITMEDLPPEMTQGTTAASGDLFKLPAEGVNFEDVERSLIMQAMDRTDNNITKSAKLLGLTFRTLQYRLEKFGFRKDGDGSEEADGE